jgi:ankyrin repeat protein
MASDYSGRVDIVHKLLKHQASTYEINYNGSFPLRYSVTPLHMEVGSNNFEVVQALIDYSDLTIKNDRGLTPLDIAILCQHQQIQVFIVNYEPLPIKEPEFN